MANSELTSKQQAAITALVAGCNYQEAAARAGVHPNRITLWLKETAFAAALHQAEQAALEAVSRDLLSLAGKARYALEEILDGNGAPSLKLRAADIVLARLLQVRELVTLEERLAALEAVVHDDQNKN